MNLVSLLVIYIIRQPLLLVLAPHLVNSNEASIDNVQLNSSPPSVPLRRLNVRGGGLRGGGRGRGGRGASPTNPDWDENNPTWQQPRLDNRMSRPPVDGRVNRDPVRTPRRRQKCRKIEIENGVTQLKNRGAFVKYFCSHGFQMLGNSYAGCNSEGGQWSSPPPVCTRSGCPQLMTPTNGAMVESYGDSVVDFYCNYGFRLVRSSAVLFCDGIRWNGTEPECEEIPSPPLLTVPPPTMPPRSTESVILQTTTPPPEIDIGLNGSWGIFSPQQPFLLSSDLPTITNEATTTGSTPVVSITESVTDDKLPTIINVLPSSFQVPTEKTTTIRPTPSLVITSEKMITTMKTATTNGERDKFTTPHSTTIPIKFPSMTPFNSSTVTHTTVGNILNSTIKTFMTPRTTLATTTKTFPITQNTTKIPLLVPTTTGRSTMLNNSVVQTTMSSIENTTAKKTTKPIKPNNGTIVLPFNTTTLCNPKTFQFLPECRQYIQSTLDTIRNRTTQRRKPFRFSVTTDKYNNVLDPRVRPTTIMTTSSLLTTTTTRKIVIPKTTNTFSPSRSTVSKVTEQTTTTVNRREQSTEYYSFDNTIDQVLSQRKVKEKKLKEDVLKQRHELISPFNIHANGILEGTKYSQTHHTDPSNNHDTSILVTLASLFCVVVTMGVFSFLFYRCWRKNIGIARPNRSDSDGRNLSVVHDTDEDFVYFGTSQL